MDVTTCCFLGVFLLQEGVPAKMFNKYAEELGILEHPYMVDALHHILIQETHPL